MRRQEITLDDEAARILDSLAGAHGGDPSLAIQETLRMNETIESFLDQLEEAHAPELLRQKERSEREFREGKVVTWDEVRRRNNL